MSVRTATSSTARTHKKQLRDVLPPLALLYLFEKWLPTAPPKAEMQAALGALRAHLVVSSCDSVYYLADVVRVVCTLALQLEPATATVPLPHPSNPNPPVDARSLTVRISTLAYNRYALTLYLHGVYLEAFRSTIVARAAALGTGGGGDLPAKTNCDPVFGRMQIHKNIRFIYLVRALFKIASMARSSTRARRTALPSSSDRLRRRH